MNADRLLQVYEQISEAPDAVARLRRFVLDLAVRGKLVEQDAEDEPASIQYNRIVAAKALLDIKEKTAKKKLLDPSLTEISFDLPVGWAEARFSDLVRVVNGRAYKRSELLSEGTPVLRVGNLFTSDHWYYSDLNLEEDKYCDKGDLIYAWSASFGPFIWEGPRVIYHYHIWKLPLFSEDDLSKRYIFLYLLQKTREIKDAGHGISMIHMTKEKMEQLAVPLPPLAEQHRIVAKVDELMGLCDRLEEARKEREATRDRLTTASLARLTAPDTTQASSGKVETGFPSDDAQTDDSDFPAHAAFALNALPALTSRPHQIKSLRQTILNLAVQGKLVKCNSGSFESVGNYKKLQNGYAFKSGWFTKTGIRLLRNANIGHGDIKWTDTVYLPTEMAQEYERFALAESDIVLTLDRPFIVTGTKVARVKATDLPSLLLQRVGRFVSVEKGLSDDYLFMWINSPHFNDQIDPGRSNGVPHISSKQVEAAEIFVPSLSEQHRIVSKVDELMALCDQLQAALTKTDTTRTRLLEALLHEALEPSSNNKEAAE